MLATFARIERDPRHANLMLLHRACSAVIPRLVHGVSCDGADAALNVNSRIDLSQFDEQGASNFWLPVAKA